MPLDAVIKQLQQIVWHLERPLSGLSWDALEADLQGCYQQVIELSGKRSGSVVPRPTSLMRAALPDMQKMCHEMQWRNVVGALDFGRQALQKLEPSVTTKQHFDD